jgi:hypothetical protein
MPVEQILESRWPSGDSTWLFGLKLRVHELAHSLGLAVNEWEEDGLGLQRGMLLRLETGRVILVSESPHAIEYLGSKGASVEVDAYEAAELGFEALATEVTTQLGLSNDHVVIVPADLQTWRQEAADRAAWAKQRRRPRGS